MSNKNETPIAAINTQIVIESFGKKTDSTFRALSKFKKIKTQLEFDQAAEKIKFLKNVRKSAKAEERKLMDPIEAWVGKHFTPFYNKVDSTEKEIKALMLDFLANNKEKLLKLENDVKSGKIKNISTYVEKAAELSIESEHASVGKRWAAIIKDESKIPRKFLAPNVVAINEHLRKGGKPIPGISWEQIDNIRI